MALSRKRKGKHADQGSAVAAEIPPAALRARQNYIGGAQVRAILAEADYSLEQLYHWLDGAPQPDGTTLLPPIPRRRIIVRRAGRAATRLALVERLLRATEMQVHAIEQKLSGAGYEPNDDDARATAVLARTMRELIALYTATGKPQNEPGKPNDDPMPRDVDELRRTLSRKLEALVAEQQAALPGQSEIA